MSNGGWHKNADIHTIIYLLSHLLAIPGRCELRGYCPRRTAPVKGTRVNSPVLFIQIDYIYVNLFLPTFVLSYNKGDGVTDERLLIKRAKQGDMEAFHELVEFSKINVYRLAYDMVRNRHDAEDISQDVFLQAYRSLDRFRGDAKWSTWLYRITVNMCIDRGKSMKRKAVEYRDDIGTDGPSELHSRQAAVDLPDRSAESSMIQGHVEQALDALSSQERTVFVLRHYHDLPLKEIAASLSLAEGTVKSYLFRAVQRLQKELSFYRPDFGLEKKS